MMARMLPGTAACVFCCLCAIAAYAQTEPISAAPPPPANLAFVDGSVDVVHEGVVERADPPTMLVDGDSVRTAYGRAEIVFADGTLLHLDRDSDLEILSPDRVRLVRGRVIVRVSAAATRAYFVDTPPASVRLDTRGEYTVSAVNPARNDLEVSVARGTAEIDDGSQRVVVRAGESISLAAAGMRAVFRTFNSARWDEFARWSNERATGLTTAQSSGQLPVELRSYAPVFDDYGRWDYLEPYGNVWYPAVGVAWRPYYDGWWGHTRYGWTWHGRDRWAWPTHHYGRWGHNGASWFWIPTNVWGPGWVSWGFSGGYVSWAPLGFDGHPAIGWPKRDHPAYAPHSPWRGWTVVPRHYFGGPRRPVRAYAIDGNRLDDPTRIGMVFGNGGPPVAAGARPIDRTRGSVTPVRRPPGTRDVPTYDRSGQVRRPGVGSTVAPTDSAGPRNRVTPAPRVTATPPPEPLYIGGSARKYERPQVDDRLGNTPNDPAVRRPVSENTEPRDRRILSTRPETAGSGDADRGGSIVPVHRGRPPASGGERSRGDGERAGGERAGTVRAAGGESRARSASEGGARAREGGGTAGARSGGWRGGDASAGARSGGRSGGGQGGGQGGRVGRSR